MLQISNPARLESRNGEGDAYERGYKSDGNQLHQAAPMLALRANLPQLGDPIWDSRNCPSEQLDI
jgi:hypothetical protein